MGGTEVFWRMHEWLFECRGKFTDDELRQFVEEMGLTAQAIFAAIQDDATMEVIRTDAAAADAAGLQFTPMVFINGRPIDIGR